MRIARPPQRLGGDIVSQWDELMRRQGFWDVHRRMVEGVHSFSLTFPSHRQAAPGAGAGPAAIYAITYNSGTEEFEEQDLREAREWLLQGFRVIE